MTKFLTDKNIFYITSIVGTVGGLVGIFGAFGWVEPKIAAAVLAAATAINSHLINFNAKLQPSRRRRLKFAKKN